MTKAEVIELLQKQIARAGSQNAYAREIGVSQPYLNDVMNGRREPGPAILRALGLEGVLMFEKKKK